MVSSIRERDAGGNGGEAGVAASEPKVRAVSPRKKRAPAKEDGHVSQALKTVYQRAVDEDIPSEMLDLLSKLD
ncbi:MAG: NepR family anti-sigma factor [Pseudomonadota bacterium]|uniref:NepR family anti-sigma factor n=1 Tax=Sphingobium sp. TaxID=1912891 RepID=UPI002E1FD68F